MMRCFALLLCLMPVASAPAGDFSPVTGVRAAAAGEFHSCLALQEGTVECFGLNEYGQLGDGTTRHRVTAGPVIGLDDAVHVVAGASHSCALREAGTIVCWGRNQSGQLGDGSTNDSLVPIAVSGLTGVTQLSAGPHHTCAVTQEGSAWCWGANASGQLGDGTMDPRSSPTVVQAPLTNAVHIDAGGAHTCAVTEDGAVFCWGANEEGQLGTGGATVPSSTPVALNGLTSGVEAVSAGAAHACALRENGSVACWGRNASGQAGSVASEPRTVPATIDGVQAIEAIAAGRAHTCVLDTDAQVSCWGEIDSTGVSLAATATIDTSHDHVCAALLDGQARCWGGEQAFGERGTGYSRMRLDAVAVRSNTREVEAGTTFACALDTAGFVRCWGSPDDTEIFGEGIYFQPEPRLIPELAEITALSSSEFHVCAQKTDVAICWGGTGYGEAVPGVWPPIPRPTMPVTGVGPIDNLHAGMSHTCAVTTAGAAVCWGQAPLGDGSLDWRDEPVTVSGLASGVRHVAVGAGHRCALLDDGTVKCWGHLYTIPANAPNPTIGDGSGESQLVPIAIPGLQDVIALDAGFLHTCAVLATGRLRCWGFNGEGQLGDGTTTARFTPVEVPGLENVAEVHAGMHNTCAILEDASAVCWGRGTLGQLGNGKRESSPVPVPVTVWDEPLADFGIGENFACAVSTAGALRCWGGNAYLQLGQSGLQGSYGRTVQRSLAPYRVFGAGFESE